MSMKNLYRVILFAVALSVAACAPVYEEDFDTLALDFEDMSVSATAEKALVTVYYSGAWTASLPEDIDWARLDQTSGRGITDINILFDTNIDPVRATVLTIRTDSGDSRQINVTQKGPSGAYLAFEFETAELPADVLTIAVPFTTNMSDAAVSKMFEDFVTEELSSVVTWEMSEPDFLDNGVVRREISLTIAENLTGQDRTIELQAKMTDSDGKEYGSQLSIVQDARKAYLSIQENVSLNRSAAECSFVIDHNLGMFADSLKLAVSYPGEDKDFISDVSISGGNVLSFSVSEIQADRDREADISLSLCRLGLELSAVMHLTQKYALIQKEITVSELVGAFDSLSGAYVSADGYTDYIRLYVVGGAGNPNMDQNINIGPNEITTDENDRTVYMQDALENPAQGFRVKFADKADNTLSHGDCVELHLEGCTLIKETSPDRYTIDGLTGSNIVKESEGHTVVPSVRSISSLSPADVYTYCKLENMEFQIKDGAYTNVREYAAIRNVLTPEGMTVNYMDDGATKNSALKTGSQFAMDGAANLLFGNDSRSIYMLMNMDCDWRRNSVPVGTGSVSGIIVHQDMPRWGGNMGVYSIRPVKEDDFNFSAVSSCQTLASWVLDKRTKDETLYSWKHGDDNAEGYSGEEVPNALMQNKLCAVTGQTTALLYSENVMLQRSAGQKRTTPVTIDDGYKGTDMTSPDSGDTYGGSTGTRVSFWANPSGWFEWDGDNVAGYRGLVMEFSTETISASSFSVGFSIAAGYTYDNNICAFQSSTSFPVYWKVEYAVSDDGIQWSSYSDAVNEATGVAGFEMRSVPWTFGVFAWKFHHHYTSDTALELVTQSDTGFGFVPYRYSIPGSVAGKKMVKVRIRPYDDTIMTYNKDWKAGLASAKMKAVAPDKQKQNVNHGLILEDVIIQYR